MPGLSLEERQAEMRKRTKTEVRARDRQTIVTDESEVSTIANTTIGIEDSTPEASGSGQKNRPRSNRFDCR